jgi:hypothetical protein
MQLNNTEAMKTMRSGNRFTGAALIWLACAGPMASWAVDTDGDGLEDPFENALMQRFAPLVSLHPFDEYRPASVDWYLPRTVMRFEHNNCSDCPEGMAGWPTDGLLFRSHEKKDSLCVHNGILAYSWNTTPSPSDLTHFFLVIPHDADKETTRQGNLATAACYAHVRPAAQHPGMFDIQYWFFYPYNGDIPYVGHEGDWEHITVRVEPDAQTIHRVLFDAHDTLGHWYSADSSSQPGYILIDGRPLVYSAYHSHASYPSAGEWTVDIGTASSFVDATEDGGPVWDCRTNLVNVGEGYVPTPGCEWLQFTGRWGEIGPVGNGPYGPAFKGKWNAEDPEENISDHGWIVVAQSSPSPGDGSWEHPFHEFTAGAAAVPTGGTVWIFPGLYPAAGIYTKPMALQAVSGGVTLGQ